MENDMLKTLNRRNFITWCTGAFAALSASRAAAAIETPSATEGPYYPQPSMRFSDVDNDLVKIAGMVEEAGGEIITLAGRILDANGRPRVGYRIEIWQCDANGRYRHPRENASRPLDENFQGHGFTITNAEGLYRFRTIRPVPYPGRTPHIHVAVFPADENPFITQLYIAGEERNETDFLYKYIPSDKRHLVTAQFEASTTPGADQQASFDIILNRTDGTPQDR